MVVGFGMCGHVYAQNILATTGATLWASRLQICGPGGSQNFAVAARDGMGGFLPAFLSGLQRMVPAFLLHLVSLHFPRAQYRMVRMLPSLSTLRMPTQHSIN